MTDIPALWINGGILVLTGVMALVAIVQARHALADAGKAEKARDEAVAAQKASAAALAEANQIAADARDLLKTQDARDTERHHVRWEPSFDHQSEKWMLANHGLDTALDVRLRADTRVMPRMVLEESEVKPETALAIEMPAKYRGQGFVPQVRWSVEWRTPLGATHVKEGMWPTNF